jgi:hypothetical protein
MSAVDVISEIRIQRPVSEVADFAANPDNAPGWYVNIKSVEWKSEKPLRVGSKVAFVAQFLGRRLSYTYEVTEFIPHQRLIMRTHEGPFPMETTYTWESTSDREARMMLRNRGTPSGFSRLLAPFTFGSFESTLDEFRIKRDNNINYIKTTADDLRNHFNDFPFGKIDSYQTILFMAGHSKRHTEQIAEIMNDASFPKK